ncbi:hypothetical protein [Flavobacterium poyangense]|uniref:hypothetical protein n=1 Tax=Flavobacterium poyangense TaxID=2204302 RepID=UPI001422EF08|nr:hypothetical protein [Flavobacterium sp. JXAS1]
MEKDNRKSKIIFIISISILLTGCSRNYIGTYHNSSNSNLYNSEIIIDNEYLTYKAMSDMLGNIIQKEKYLVKKDSIIVKFQDDPLILPYTLSYFDNQINGIKITLMPILTNDSIPPIVNVIVNDSIKYTSGRNDTILNIKRLKKIHFEDVGLKFVKDTTITFLNETANVFKIRLKNKYDVPVLKKNGTIKYLIDNKKLYLLDYDKSVNNYVRSNKYYLKR